MFKKGFRYVFMDQAGDGTEGGAGAGETGAEGTNNDTGASADAATDIKTTASGANTAGTDAGTVDAGTSGTALQQGQTQQAAQIPEKYQVKKEDGSLDIEASSLKLAEAYGHLEKRMGTGDIPPKTADEYEIAVPDVLKDKWNPKEDPLLGDFLKKAHENNYTQKQIDLAMSTYLDIVPQLVNGSKQLTEEECVAELKTEWKTDEQYKAEVNKAYKAAVAYGDKDAEAIIKDYGNDARIIRLLSRVGKELGEDSPPNNGGGSNGGQSVETMMASEAYTNPKHPDHARVSAQVQKHFKHQAKEAEKSGNIPLL